MITCLICLNYLCRYVTHERMRSKLVLLITIIHIGNQYIYVCGELPGTFVKIFALINYYALHM